MAEWIWQVTFVFGEEPVQIRKKKHIWSHDLEEVKAWAHHPVSMPGFRVERVEIMTMGDISGISGIRIDPGLFAGDFDDD